LETSDSRIKLIERIESQSFSAHETERFTLLCKRIGEIDFNRKDTEKPLRYEPYAAPPLQRSTGAHGRGYMQTSRPVSPTARRHESRQSSISSATEPMTQGQQQIVDSIQQGVSGRTLVPLTQGLRAVKNVWTRSGYKSLSTTDDPDTLAASSPNSPHDALSQSNLTSPSSDRGKDDQSERFLREKEREKQQRLVEAITQRRRDLAKALFNISQS
jgi:hypothetical protein